MIESKQARIIIIDDEDDALEMMCGMIRAAGWDCVGINRAEECLEAITNLLPDLVFLDIMMPDTDGLEICKLIKKKKETEHIPVVIVSAKGMRSDIQKGYDAGADEYLIKPVGFMDMKECVEKVLRRKMLGLYNA